jgi:4-aminobutyrate aminotransferase/(S)-3-amino-2-methylpropionate transaminase
MSELESIHSEIPGPRSREHAARLARLETRGVTYLAGDFPVFWTSAYGATVTDVDANRYLDLTSAFGVAATGHANPAVARAIADQAMRLPHGMGDVHPSDVKSALLERLAALAPVDDARIFLCSSGAESVEFALKTAALATGKPDVVSFEGAYHGLSYGTLEVGGIQKFRAPWSDQLRNAATFVAFPDRRDAASAAVTLARIKAVIRDRATVGAVIVEPIQGRAGIVIPPDGFLRELRALCDRLDVLLILDEIYTGFGRTGTMFACERDGVRPDILCIGKALGGGFPISATIVARRAADAWQPSRGEALHTSTYLGNPMGCAAALANIDEIERLQLPERARGQEMFMRERLERLRERTDVVDVRGRGMLWGVEFESAEAAARCVVCALQRGLILLQSGVRGETIALAPPLVIADDQLARALELLESVVLEKIAV